MGPTRLAAAVVCSSALLLAAACDSGDDTGAGASAGAGATGADAATGGDGGSSGPDASTGGASGTGGSSAEGGSGAVGGSGATGGSGGTGGTGATGGTGGIGGSSATGGSGGSTAPTCGDGVRNQSWEQCDGTDTGGANCAALQGSNYAGPVYCTGSCTYDTSACYCVPSCAGKACGADGCGSTCGDCGTYGYCSGGTCVCSDSCAGKQCGTNLCGVSCGQCNTGDYCYGGQCIPACVPACGTKVCGSNGCGDVCGQCGVNDTCSSGQCAACAHSCPTLTAVGASTSTQCFARMDDCSACGPATCGTAHYAYGCWGGDAPALSGCFKTSSSEYCCTQAACLRYTVADSYCTNAGMPPHGYSCKPGVTPGAGCVLYPSGSDGPAYCCP